MGGGPGPRGGKARLASRAMPPPPAVPYPAALQPGLLACAGGRRALLLARPCSARAWPDTAAFNLLNSAHPPACPPARRAPQHLLALGLPHHHHHHTRTHPTLPATPLQRLPLTHAHRIPPATPLQRLPFGAEDGGGGPAVGRGVPALQPGHPTGADSGLPRSADITAGPRGAHHVPVRPGALCDASAGVWGGAGRVGACVDGGWGPGTRQVPAPAG